MHPPTLLGPIAGVAVLGLVALAGATAQAGIDDARAKTPAPTITRWTVSNPGVIPAVNAAGVPYDVGLQTGARTPIARSRRPRIPRSAPPGGTSPTGTC